MRENFRSNRKFDFRLVLMFVPYTAVHILLAPPIICWLIFCSAIFQNEKNETLSLRNNPAIQYYYKIYVCISHKLSQIITALKYKHTFLYL